MARTSDRIRKPFAPKLGSIIRGSHRWTNPDRAVVEIVTIDVAAELPSNVRLLGEKLQVLFAGKPAHVSAIAELNPLNGPTVSVKVVGWPAVTVAFGGVADRLKSVPAPRSAMVCGLPPALSAIEIVPVFLATLVGANVTSISQFAPEARGEVMQVLVWPKLPLAVTPMIFRLAVPPLVMVTV